MNAPAPHLASAAVESLPEDDQHRGPGGEDRCVHCRRAASPYLSVQEAADFLRTTPRAIYRLAERGVLPGARRLGRRLLVRRADLIRGIEKSKSKGRVPASTDGETQA